MLIDFEYWSVGLCNVNLLIKNKISCHEINSKKSLCENITRIFLIKIIVLMSNVLKLSIKNEIQKTIHLFVLKNKIQILKPYLDKPLENDILLTVL